jgi:hypothetical protein
MEDPDERATEAEFQGCAGCLAVAGVLAAIFSIAVGVPPAAAWVAVIAVVAAFAAATFVRR